MREHIGLFRGKRKDNGEWAEGAYAPPFKAPNGKEYGVSITVVGESGWLEDIYVDPNTIGECTSLKDKNGKLIFEHQAIKYAGELYEVRMWVGMWCMFDKWEHYCELYKFAADSEILEG